MSTDKKKANYVIADMVGFFACPFCGRGYDIRNENVHNIGTPYYSYTCYCGIKTPRFQRKETLKAFWNRRS